MHKTACVRRPLARKGKDMDVWFTKLCSMHLFIFQKKALCCYNVLEWMECIFFRKEKKKSKNVNYINYYSPHGWLLHLISYTIIYREKNALQLIKFVINVYWWMETFFSLLVVSEKFNSNLSFALAKATLQYAFVLVVFCCWNLRRRQLTILEHLNVFRFTELTRSPCE